MSRFSGSPTSPVPDRPTRPLTRLSHGPHSSSAGRHVCERTDSVTRGCIGKTRAFAALVVWASIAATLLTFAWYCWPILDGEAGLMLQPMITFAKGQGLVSQMSADPPVFDRLGRLVFHGFLYQVVVGGVSLNHTYPSIILTIAILEVLALAFCCFLFHRTIRLVSHQPSWWHTILLASSTLGLATALLGLSNRPEPFALLIVALGANLLFLLPWRYHSLVAGSALALLGTSHPVGAILTGLTVGIYGSVRTRPREWILWMGKTALVCSAVFALSLSAYPYPISNWIQGLSRHYRVLIETPSGTYSAFGYWFISPRASFYGSLYLFGLGAALSLSRRYRDRIRAKGAFLLSSLLLLGASYYFGMRVENRNYNLQVLAPLVFAVVIAFLGAWMDHSAETPRSWPRRIGALTLVAILALPSSGFLRQVALFPFFLRDGMSYDAARSRLAALRQNAQGTVWLDSGLFALTEDYTGIAFDTNRRENGEVSLVILQQTNRGVSVPPELPGFALVEDHFSRTVPRLFGVKIGNTVGGYNFAVYRRDARGKEHVRMLPQESPGKS